MSEEIKLKPCPFCGGEVKIADVIEYEKNFVVVCRISKGGCGETGVWRKSKEEAIEDWNRRADNGIIDRCDGCISYSCESCVRNQHLYDYYERR